MDTFGNVSEVRAEECLRPLNPSRVCLWIIRELQRDLIVHEGRIRRFVTGYDDVLKPLKGVKSFALTQEAGEAAFVLDKKSGRMAISSQGLDRMISQAAKLERGRLGRANKRLAVETYVAHEVVHIGQNLADFADVQDIKISAGVELLGQMDLMADIRAGSVVAGVNLARKGPVDLLSYAKELKATLSFQGEVGTKAFKAPATKIHKVQRALGLALSVIHLDAAVRIMEREPGWIPSFPLDAVLWPIIGSDKRWTVLRLLPNIRVEHRSVALDDEDINSLVDLLHNAPFQDVVDAVRRSLEG